MSKFGWGEFKSYGAYFGSGNGKRLAGAFNKSWKQHIHGNKHHWQFWLVTEDDGSILTFPMPESYLREMVADWVSANFQFRDVF